MAASGLVRSVHPSPACKAVCECAVAKDYDLYKGEAGWDLPGIGDLGKSPLPSSLSQEDAAVECANKCDRKSGCTIFTLLDNVCYFKRDEDATPVFIGEQSDGWPKLYIEQ